MINTRFYDVRDINGNGDGKDRQDIFFASLYVNYFFSEYEGKKIFCLDKTNSASIDLRKVYHADGCTILTDKDKRSHAVAITGEDERIPCVESLLEHIARLSLEEIFTGNDHKK